MQETLRAMGNETLARLRKLKKTGPEADIMATTFSSSFYREGTGRSKPQMGVRCVSKNIRTLVDVYPKMLGLSVRGNVIITRGHAYEISYTPLSSLMKGSGVCRH